MPADPHQVWIPVKPEEISEVIESSAEDLSETSAASGGDDVGRAVCINSSPRYKGARGTSRPTGPAWMETSRHFNVKRAGEEPRLPWDLSEEVVLSCMTTPHFCNSEAIKKMHDIRWVAARQQAPPTLHHIPCRPGDTPGSDPARVRPHPPSACAPSFSPC